MANVSGYSNSYTLRIDCWQYSQNIEGNYSDVKWRIVFSSGTMHYQNQSTVDTFKCWVNGQEVHNQKHSVYFSGPNTSITIAEGQTRVYHNADGKKTISFSGSYSPGKSAYYYPGYISASGGKLTLSTIPRASSFNLSTSSLTTGSTMIVYISRASSNFTHKVDVTMGGWTNYVIANNVGTSASYSFGHEWFDKSSTKTSLSGTIRVTTYSGSTYVGSKSTSFSLALHSSIVPSIDTYSITANNDTATSNKFGSSFIQNKSKANFSFASSGSYGSTITTNKIVINNDTYYQSSGTTGTIESTSCSYTITVTDSRGRSSSVEGKFSLLPYYFPSATSFSGFRSNSDGNKNELSGKYFTFNYGYDIAPVNNKNDGSAYIQEYKNGAWTSIKTVTNGYTNSGTYTTTSQYSEDSTPIFRLAVYDYASSDTKSITMSSTFTLINFNQSGYALAFGGASELSSGLEYKMNTYYDNNKSIYGKDKLTGNQLLAFEPCNTNGNLTIGWGGYEQGANETNVYGNRTNVIAKDRINLSVNGSTGYYMNDSGENHFNKYVEFHGNTVFDKYATFNSDVTLTGGSGLYINYVDSSNYCLIKYASYEDKKNIYYACTNGYHAFYSFGKALYIDLKKVDDNWSSGSFYPGSEGVALGGTSYWNRWYRLYATNSPNISSDRRLKENIEYMSDKPVEENEIYNQYEKIFNALKPSTFTLKEDSFKKTKMGFIAQDVIQAIENVGLTVYDVDFISHGRDENGKIDENAYYGLCYDEFVALNTHMIQKANKKIAEQQETIDTLQKKIELMEKQNQDILARLEKLES